MTNIHLSNSEIKKRLDTWLHAWNHYDLEGIMHWIHDDIIFENWDGKTINKRALLYKAWKLWFNDHGNFHFKKKDVVVDEPAQTFVFTWELIWLSRESGYKGHWEIRKGVDQIRLSNGKILSKQTYSKTYVQIDNKIIQLRTCK